MNQALLLLFLLFGTSYMNGKSHTIIYIVAILFVLLANRQSGNAQDNYEIRKIIFSGNDSIANDQLLNALTIHSTNFLEKKFTKKNASLYNSQLIDNETDRLTRYYQQQGFLETTIEAQPNNIDDKHKHLNLQFKIEEGPSYRIDSIAFKINGTKPDFDADSLFQHLSAKLQLKKGGRFTDEAIGADLANIRLAFQNEGYFYTETSYQLQLKPEKHLVAVSIEVTPGEKTYFGPTNLEGNKHVSDQFIRKQLSWNEGDLFSSKKLDDTRKNMYKLQLFSVLSMQTQTDESHRANIPVKLVISEAPRFNSKFGAGYGTEDKFRAFAEMTYKGFLGGARRLNFTIKHSALSPYDFKLNWIQPQFLSKKLSASVGPFISRIKEPGYEIRDVGVNLKLSFEINDQLTVNGTYFYDRVKQLQFPGDTSLFNLTDLPYNKSGIIISSVFDNSFPKFSPVKGFNILLAWKLNGYAFGGDFSFNRLWTDIRNYQSVGKVVLASRLMMGSTLGKSSSYSVPSEDRFYAGGSNSVRGWERSMLGPLTDENTPLGGASVLQGSFEFRIPLVGKFGAVGFLDYGNAWINDLVFKLKELAYAAGGGLRFDTPIGPVRFDLGVPVWNEKRSAQFFISVGQAF